MDFLGALYHSRAMLVLWNTATRGHVAEIGLRTMLSLLWGA